MPRIFSDLENKIVLVTGAGQAIGRGIAKYLALQGMKVGVADINQTTGASLVEEIAAEGGVAYFIPVDLTNDSSVRAMADSITERFGGLDVLVNNARPFIQSGPFPECMADWTLAMDVMVRAPAIAIEAALPALAAADGGSVVNISSTNAFLVSQQPLTYHVAKAALVQMTRCLAVELAPRGIRVNAVCPGLVDVPDRRRPLTSDPINRHITEAIVPLGRAGTPGDIAATVAFLSSSLAAAYMTGQVLIVDGGLTVRDQFDSAKRTHFRPPAGSIR